MKRVRLSLTIPQALALRLVAGNGYGDGDFFHGRAAAPTRAAFLRALAALEDATEAARGEFANRMTETNAQRAERQTP